MGWLTKLLDALFGVFFKQAAEEIKNPDEGHFVGGDKNLRDDVADSITDEMLGDCVSDFEKSYKEAKEDQAIISEAKKKKDQEHG